MKYLLTLLILLSMSGCATSDKYRYLPEKTANTTISYTDGEPSLVSTKNGDMVSMSPYSVTFSRDREAKFLIFAGNGGSQDIIFSISDITCTHTNQDGQTSKIQLLDPDKLRSQFGRSQYQWIFISKDTIGPKKSLFGIFALEGINRLGVGKLTFNIKTGNQFHQIDWKLEENN